MPNFPESIEPGPEQRLFEKLSNEPEDLEALEFIRRMMKKVIIAESNEQENKSE